MLDQATLTLQKKDRQKELREARTALQQFQDGRLPIPPRKLAELRDLEERVTTSAVAAARAEWTVGLARKEMSDT